MENVIVYKDSVYDEVQQTYVTCYYSERSLPPLYGGLLQRHKSFYSQVRSGYKPRTCHYYFYQPGSQLLYTSKTFGNLLLILLELGYESDNKLLRTVQKQDGDVCLVLRPKLNSEYKS